MVLIRFYVGLKELLKDTKLIEVVVCDIIVSAELRIKDIEKELRDIKVREYQKRQKPLDFL